MAPAFDIDPEKRATQGAFMKRQLFHKPSLVTRKEVDLAGHTAVITGSNSGLGFECAKQLLDLGLSKLILAVRSEAKGEAAKKTLLATRTSKKISVEVWKLDLSYYESITTFAERTKTLERLNIFINNAGVSKKNFENNKYSGHEESVQINFLSMALLTILMLPILKEKNSPQHPGRLVIVSSDTASWTTFKEREPFPILANLDKPELFDIQDRYATSKLLGQLWISELVKRIPPSVAVINAPNPGLCKSSLVNEFSGTFTGFLLKILELIFARDAHIGARALTDAAVKHGEESHGQYLEDGKVQAMAPIVYRPEGEKLDKQLYQETLDELAFAQVGDIISSLRG
ncbi:hypothetical protein DL764_003075 [Monosporascus ibericus]|uniref:Ketoreductase (KR) domain-containing protein n=1 Tax=Monosporascus ibericus TaxID=155417 RepID=A0A4Q4THZ7_9PEZI|nr:hypothetical protein DL764_003075 [Monosporascus ibericus]